MRKLTILLSFSLLFLSFHLNAQENNRKLQIADRFTLGMGLGFDYGGIGGNFMVYPTNSLGLFGGVGYALSGVGYNFGAKYRILSKKADPKVVPYFVGMYGYNAVINVTDASQYNKFFYGPTVGFGLDIKSNPFSRGYWSVALLVPIRGTDVNAYIDDLKNNHGVQFKNDLLPIGISVGYRIILK